MREQIIKMRELKNTFVIFGQGTRQVFVTCDEETFEDQIHVFSSEKLAKAWAQKRAEENKDMLFITNLENGQLLQFYGGLFGLGVTEIVFTDEKGSANIPLEKLVQQRELDKLPPEKRPLVNPQMQLTGIYFMQEIYRRLPNSEKPKLRELEEEMAANLVRSRFLMATEAPKDVKNPKPEDIRLPCVQTKEGKMYQPIFTDPAEYRKFDRKNRFRPIVVEFSKIQQVLGKNIEGITVNPQSINIIIAVKIIPTLLERFGITGVENNG